MERSLSPELAGAQKTLADFLAQNDEQEFNSLKPGLIDDIRSAQSSRGIGAISPLGSIDESVQLMRLKQSLKDRRLNVALSTAGRVPISQMPTVQGQTGTGQLVNNVNPDSIFNYQQSLNNFNASIFGTQANLYNTSYNNATARRGQNMDLLGSIVGAGGSAAGTIGAANILAACWVAAEIFNEPMDGINVSKARKFILNEAPDWFRNFYVKHGKAIAEYIHNKPKAKKELKPLFDYFVERGA